jgi:uncharacterized caspase-like protein
MGIVVTFSLARWCLGCLLCLVALMPAHAAERRLALVVGNSAYKNAPLVNPGNDARAVAAALRESGFTVIERRNLNQAAMRQVVREFGDELAKGGIGLFYYAGHGMQIRGRNFLIPVGSDIQREDEVQDQAVDASLVLEKMASAKNAANIVILDACRNNPFASSFRSAAAGLAVMDAPAGTLIAFSTAPGQVAADGTGDNGLYTQHLVTYMREPGLKVEDVFKRVRVAVRQGSGGKQVPWENTSLETDIYFKLPDATTVAEDREERSREQQAAIDRAVKEALARAAQQAAGDRASVEKEIAQRVATERAEVERVATQRVAAIEKSLRDATFAGSAADAKAPQTTSRAVAAADGAGPGSVTRAAVLPKVNDGWVYRITEREYGKAEVRNVGQVVEAVTENEIHLRSGKRGSVRTTHDWNWLMLVARDGVPRTFDPYIPQFSFPLEPGKSWEGRYMQARTSGHTFQHDATVTVVGWEEVTVPAGTFKALKMTGITWYKRTDLKGGGAGKILSNYWLAPEVKRVVKLEILNVRNNRTVHQDDTWELVKYRVQ